MDGEYCSEGMGRVRGKTGQVRHKGGWRRRVMWVGWCLRKEGCGVMQGWRYGGVQLGRWNEPPLH